MKTTPQKVTERYVHGLMRRGFNPHFRIQSIDTDSTMIDEVIVATYYKAMVYHNGVSQVAVGSTPFQAVYRALIKHGVTFR